MQLIKAAITILILLSSLMRINAIQDCQESPANPINQVTQAEIEQIILSYIKTYNLNIVPETREYALFMKGILLGEYPELSFGNSVFVKSEETRVAVLDYAWDHMKPIFEGSQFDPRNFPISEARNLDISLDYQSPKIEGTSSAQNRASAIAYAYLWSQQGSAERNPLYPDFGYDDCTNFVSQAMFAAGYPKVGSGDGCTQESTFFEWYVNANPNPSLFCTGDFREWEWATPWSVPADYREYFAHRSSNAIEFGYTENPGIAAYYLIPGDVVQLMRRDEENWYTYHTMIVTKEDGSGLYVTYHSDSNGLDVVDRPLHEIATSPTNVYMLVRMFPEKVFLPVITNNSNFTDQSDNLQHAAYPAPTENYSERFVEPSILTGYPVP